MSKVQIIRDDDDKPIFALVPWSEYEALIGSERGEDYALGAMAAAARDDEKFPAEIAKRLIKGELPLRVFREWRGLTQAQLGKKAEVAPQYISQIERGERGIGVDAGRKLAAALKVSLEALLDTEPKIESKSRRRT